MQLNLIYHALENLLIPIDFDPIQIQVLREFIKDLGIGDDFHEGLAQLGHEIPSKDVTEKISEFVQKKFKAIEPFQKLHNQFLVGYE